MGGVANGFKKRLSGRRAASHCRRVLFHRPSFCFFRPRALVFLCFGLLAGYWALLAFVPVPGLGAALPREPGKTWPLLDELYLPGQKFEGTLLSTMGAVANCLLGVFAGLLLENGRVLARKGYWLLGAGVASLALGFLWVPLFPIIKLLWTSTYVLVGVRLQRDSLGGVLSGHRALEFQKWARRSSGSA